MENTIEAACSVEVIIKLFPSKYIYTKNDGKFLNYMHLISYQSPIKVHSWRVAHNHFKHFTIEVSITITVATCIISLQNVPTDKKQNHFADVLSYIATCVLCMCMVFHSMS